MCEVSAGAASGGADANSQASQAAGPGLGLGNGGDGGEGVRALTGFPTPQVLQLQQQPTLHLTGDRQLTLTEVERTLALLLTELLPPSTVQAAAGGATGPAQGQTAQHLPLELSQPGAMELLTLLQRVWQTHAHTAASTASGAAGGGAVTSRVLKVHQRRAAATGGVQVPPSHCSTREGAQLLKQVAQAVEALHAHTCSADRGAGERREESTLPFVLLRRASMAVLQLVYPSNAHDEADSACREAVVEVSAAAAEQ